jgi:hypothetical protein
VSRALLRGAIVASLAAALGCASALTEPPPVAEIGTAPGGTAAEPTDPNAVLIRAESEFARRPDRAAVEYSRALFLEAAQAGNAPVEAFLGAARATAWLIEHEQDGPSREELAIEGVQIGQHCVRLYPEVAECTYRLALAVGQQARERPSTAVDGLDVMVELLEEVIATAPDLDFAGGDRVMALILLRAPAWPAGPGDPETAMVHAEKAAGSFPDHPPNLLVLAEALRENGQPERARQALRKAAGLAREIGAGGDPEAAEWLAEAEAALVQ